MTFAIKIVFLQKKYYNKYTFHVTAAEKHLRGIGNFSGNVIVNYTVPRLPVYCLSIL
jgi:hypothetical protein